MPTSQLNRIFNVLGEARYRAMIRHLLRSEMTVQELGFATQFNEDHIRNDLQMLMRVGIVSRAPRGAAGSKHRYRVREGVLESAWDSWRRL